MSEPGSENDTRLYVCVGGSHKLHILRDDGSGYFDAGTLCGVWRNLGDARDYPDPEFADSYTVCKCCLAEEES